MDWQEFEDTVRKVNKEKYHVSREVVFKDNIPVIDNWAIYRKDMPIEEFFNSNNISVLSSNNGNTIEDILRLIEENN